jgi:hypothetical protein
VGRKGLGLRPYTHRRRSPQAGSASRGTHIDGERVPNAHAGVCAFHLLKPSCLIIAWGLTVGSHAVIRPFLRAQQQQCFRCGDESAGWFGWVLLRFIAGMKKHRSPGPAAYNIKSTVCASTPAYSFGTMKRPAPNFKGISPGPAYQLKASLGKYKDFTFKANPSFGFGTSERPDPAGNSKLREYLQPICIVCSLTHIFAPQYLPSSSIKPHPFRSQRCWQPTHTPRSFFPQPVSPSVLPTCRVLGQTVHQDPASMHSETRPGRKSHPSISRHLALALGLLRACQETHLSLNASIETPLKSSTPSRAWQIFSDSLQPWSRTQSS